MSSSDLLCCVCCVYLSLWFQPVANFLEEQLVVLHVLEHFYRDDSIILAIKLFLRQVEGVYVAFEDGESVWAV